VEIDLHFVRERVALGDVRVLHVPTTSQFADIFTKGLPSSVFLEFKSSLNVRSTDDLTGGGGVLDIDLYMCGPCARRIAAGQACMVREI